jgi:hypothetical protein
MTFEGDNNEVVNNYVLSLVSDDPKKFVTFVMRQRHRATADTLTYDIQEFAKIYDLERFRRLAANFEAVDTLTTEERQALSMFLQMSRQHPSVAAQISPDSEGVSQLPAE